MKRWKIALVVVGLLAIPAFFAARHFSERHRQTTNVRHDAQWFMSALRSGNERAVSNYLAQSKMAPTALVEALKTHSQALLTTDFETAPVTFRTEGSKLLATFHCSGQAALTFYTEDGGDVWRVAELIPMSVTPPLVTTNSVLLNKRIVQITGAIDDESTNLVIAQLLFLQTQDSKSPITLRIDSPGGAITATLAVLDTMRLIKCPVITECRGVAGGGALILFAAGTPGQRRASREASFVFSRTESGSPAAPEAPKLMSYLGSLHKHIVAQLASVCRQPPSRVGEDMDAERRLTTTEAIEYGLVDEQIPEG
ncbi:MAG: ATP-dependent Clp protease proteolytic subunit [Prosthecobacter sp.]